MNGGFQPSELSFIVTLANCGSLSAAARELGITTPAVSKQLAFIEARVGVPLVNRTTRRMSMTPEGEVLLEHARRILAEIADLDQLLAASKGMPKGQLRVNATLGFGRLHIAPAISKYVLRYPEVDVQLQLSVDPPPLTDDQFDVCIRFGAPSDTRVISKGWRQTGACCARRRNTWRSAGSRKTRANWDGTIASRSARATKLTGYGACRAGATRSTMRKR
jgi:DNA-binding transcriptional LysR family regulator